MWFVRVKTENEWSIIWDGVENAWKRKQIRGFEDDIKAPMRQISSLSANKTHKKILGYLPLLNTVPKCFQWIMEKMYPKIFSFSTIRKKHSRCKNLIRTLIFRGINIKIISVRS
jgi:hypothetical protein